MRPNLSFAAIATTLAVLSCAKDPPAPTTIQKSDDPVPAAASETSALAPPALTMAPTATQTAAAGDIAPTATAPDPKREAERNLATAKDASTKAGPIGSSQGQMSCGAGSCSGATGSKKK